MSEENGEKETRIGLFLGSIGEDWYPFYDKEGSKIDMLTHAQLIQDADYSTVKQETVGDYWVSTVFLGVDASILHSRPLIFETMIFGKEGPSRTFRYTTEEEARKGHKRIVDLLKSERKLEDIGNYLEDLNGV